MRLMYQDCVYYVVIRFLDTSAHQVLIGDLRCVHLKHVLGAALIVADTTAVAHSLPKCVSDDNGWRELKLAAGSKLTDSLVTGRPHRASSPKYPCRVTMAKTRPGPSVRCLDLRGAGRR